MEKPVKKFWEVEPRTDLALEATERFPDKEQIPGVQFDEKDLGGITVSWVSILTSEAEKVMGKVRGNYVTIEAAGLKRRNRALQDRVARILGEEIAKLAKLGPNSQVFIVGLGNWRATPDSLGPRVISQVLVTRHLKDYVPAEVAGGLRSVCALTPGVLGLTGIETSEIIRAIVDRIQPDLVIAIDALAARSVDRIMTTIQLADSGIHPGSGVGNRRMGITWQTLGTKVLAIGVPTVVHAITIATDTVNMLIDKLNGKTEFYQIINEMRSDEKQGLISEVLSPVIGDLMVTPKEIDMYVEEIAKVIAGGLNMALHPNLTSEDIRTYLT